MNRLVFCLLTSWPLSFALAEETPAVRPIPVKHMDNKDISIEYLAHSFFHNSSYFTEILKQIISAEGVDRIAPEVAVLKRDLDDIRKYFPMVRQLCIDLRGARNGPEFAAVLASGDERDRIDKEEAARRILSKLDVNDRKALEEYLDREFRTGFRVSKIDYESAFAFETIPSARSTAITQRTCDSAAMIEAMVEP